ncbi:hypothetical protein GeomeDRAFT_0284 [Geobacter metallireducens RCH3]|uniref:TPR domain protein n=1 Tax=Geobacter metallireducens (strain ATCC 53774 / DSM 7210 / GS-15) TaxID=269799 RepID=Q39VT8_GEOMG|nr:hypothetical protein [Geobacter metallireducens]ABB31636.1 hypothetical protein Gmet_1402 [Geobacter metallireducens GS-15]EHP89486.1 hypothetical protein GeomeDRAFT_0284 [Geobacter metallireducens RCH3]
MKRVLLALVLAAAFFVVNFSLDRQMANRPVVVKLGYSPSGQVLKLVAGDLKPLVAEFNVLRVVIYFGSLVEKWKSRIQLPPEYPNMFRTIETAVRLDPYNMDAYYFAQAAFTWQVGHASDVNYLLDYGMKYRTRDWQLPYFAGFNAAYFLHEYDSAATYMQRAARLSGHDLLTNLTARYFYESGREDLGIAFLRDMIARTTDKKERTIYELRLKALIAVQKLNSAVRRYRAEHGALPENLQALVKIGYLLRIPDDPYGGEFFLDKRGMVRTSSQMAMARSTGKSGGEND